MPSWKIGPYQIIIPFLVKLSTPFKKKKRLNNKNIALKLNMAKAYDRMEWVLSRNCTFS